ncbi:hypothetical protein LPJ61_001418 [Coemansia biformis]|uniref:Uncharacterized protein n=1 Tax=Coemansia biformis TaxID=1286918 RepID=A0A9W7YHQ7_9FUNG|nr:hypothetical protein LPJ61_001418 [Coemansia biformis]
MERDPTPLAASTPRLRGVIVPPEDPLYRTWQARGEHSRTPPPAYPTQARLGRDPRPGGQLVTYSAQPPSKRPWWVRLLVDSMAVPFLQGFMLTLGVHWIRHWRRSGGLLGIFRGRRAAAATGQTSLPGGPPRL